MKNEPTLAQMRVFLAVVRTGSFTAAAVDLNLTQSAISHAARQLEVALGARLLDRGGQGVQLTEAGRRSLPIIRHLFEQLERLRTEAPADAPLAGTVRIASFPSLALHLLPPLLAQVRTLHPGIKVEVCDAHLERLSVERAVLRAEADIGLTQLPADARLLARSILSDPYELLMPADWDPLTLWERPYIHLGPASDDFVIRELRRAGLHLRPTLCLLTETVIVAMINQRLGFAVLPRLALQQLPEGVRRVPAPLPLVRTLGTVTRPGELSAAARCVLKLIWGYRPPVLPVQPPAEVTRADG